MKWVSYGWSVIMGLVALFISVAVINRFDTPFERIVVDLLVMAYLAVTEGTRNVAFIAMEQGKMARTRFLELMKAVGKEAYGDDNTKEQVREEDDLLHRQTIKGYIGAGFSFLIFLIALVNLFGAL